MRQEHNVLVALSRTSIIAKCAVTFGEAPKGYNSTFSWKTENADWKVYFYCLVPTQKCVFYVKGVIEKALSGRVS